MKFKEFYIQEKLNKQYDFSCILFDFPKDKSEQIMSWAKNNISPEKLVKDGLEDEIHVTVLYGVHSENPKDTFSVLTDTESFEIELGLISKFQPEDCDVLKIDVISSKLHDLRKILEKNIPNTQTHNEFRPHVTLGYVAKNSCNKLIGSDYFKGTKVLVNAVDFSSSDGFRQRMYFNHAKI